MSSNSDATQINEFEQSWPSLQFWRHRIVLALLTEQLEFRTESRQFSHTVSLPFSLVGWLWVNACDHKFTPSFTILWHLHQFVSLHFWSTSRHSPHSLVEGGHVLLCHIFGRCSLKVLACKDRVFRSTWPKKRSIRSHWINFKLV